MAFTLDGTFPFIHKDERATVKVPAATWNWIFRDENFDNDAGVTVSADTALTLSAVWRAINIISQTISTLPVGLYRSVGQNREEVFDHPGLYTLNNPNEVGSPILLKESIQTSVLTWGNGYGYIVRRRDYSPKEIWPLDPENVTVKYEKGKIFYSVAELGENIDPSRIIHIPGLSFNGVTGKSPIDVARNSLGGGLAVQKYGNTFFANGAKQSGVLMHPGVLGDKGTENLRTSFEKKMAKKENGTMILEEGMKYQSISIPPDQAQFLGSKKFTVNEVARWFGVPPHLLFEEDRSTFNNISEQGISYVMYSLLPWVRRWEEELNRKLLTEVQRKDHSFKFNLNALMRGNAKDRSEYYRMMLDLGCLNINEVRHLEEFNTIPGGEKYLVQVNRTPLDKIGEKPEMEKTQEDGSEN